MRSSIERVYSGNYFCRISYYSERSVPRHMATLCGRRRDKANLPKSMRDSIKKLKGMLTTILDRMRWSRLWQIDAQKEVINGSYGE